MKSVYWVLIAGVVATLILSCGTSPAPKNANDASATELAMNQTSDGSNMGELENTPNDFPDSQKDMTDVDNAVDEDEDDLENEDVYGGQMEDDDGDNDDDGDDDDGDDDGDDEGEDNYDDEYENDDAGDLF